MKKVITFPKILGFDAYLSHLPQDVRDCFLDEIYLLNENYFEDLKEMELPKELVRHWNNVLFRGEDYYVLKHISFEGSEMREDKRFHEAIEYYKVFLTSPVTWLYHEAENYIIEVFDEGGEHLQIL